MMDVMLETTPTFIEVAEVWVPENGKLILHAGNYGAHEGFAEASGRESFAKGEGLPGKAWAEARPVVLKGFDGTYFRRAEAAKAAGLTAAVAMPVFAGDLLKAVLVIFCADGGDRIGALEVWVEKAGTLTLDDGYFGMAKEFEFVTQHTAFARGQGLPGGVWSANTPMLMRDLGAGYGFVRAESAGKAGLSTGLGLPVPVPGGATYVLALLSAKGTPIARRFEIWDARAAKVGKTGDAVLIDGICDREGPLWDEDNPRRVSSWKGQIGMVLATGLPVIESNSSGLAAGYTAMLALPIHRGSELSFVVAWYL